MSDTPTKLYAPRDILALAHHYMRHVDAMTRESLFGKGDIAAELAWRDAEIERLRKDAERYRFLRDKGAGDEHDFWLGAYEAIGQDMPGAYIDIIVDQAIEDARNLEQDDAP